MWRIFPDFRAFRGRMTLKWRGKNAIIPTRVCGCGGVAEPEHCGKSECQEDIVMLCVENIAVTGWEAAVRGMRNPMNSWEKSDSSFSGGAVCLGENDLHLMRALIAAGTDHRKFLRYLTVTCDVTAPLYWWKEYDTYKVGTVANSCSTMHKIAAREFTAEDFSHEHLEAPSMECLRQTVAALNRAREQFLQTKDKRFWWQMIQLLPSSYNQRRTLLLNYEVLRNIYFARRNHKLDEWHTFCEAIAALPYTELIVEK